MHHGSNDVGLQAHHLSADEISHMTSMYDVGKYFKAVDTSGARPRFIMADDHLKLFPEDG